MFKKFLVPLLILSMVFFYQCKDDHILPDQDQTALKKGKGGGGSGGGGNGGGGHNGGSGGLYGDLVICLRTADGIPIYLPITGEHDLAYYPQPIMVDADNQVPLKDGDSYVVFPLNDEGEPIIDSDDYIVKEVEFGRLNIVRAPQSVLDQALNEAIASLTQNGINDITMDASGRLIAIIGAEDWLVNFDDNPTNDEFNDKTIDSPRENVAIYQEFMGNKLTGKLAFLNAYFSTDDFMIAVGAIAAGADKTGNIIVDEMAYMNDWLLKWTDPEISEVVGGSPDEKGRRYYDYSPFSYDRYETYKDKIVRVTELYNDGGEQTWKYSYYSLYDVVPWTNSNLLIDYNNNGNSDFSTGITGFSNAADDAIQVLEYLHSSDLIVYSPYFVKPTP